jgi:hypothetical protein
MRAALDRLLAAEGRAPASLAIAPKLPLVFSEDGGPEPTVGRARDVADALRRFADLGAEHFVFDVRPERRQSALDTMERFAEEVRPRLG